MLIMPMHSRSLSAAARACPVHAACLRECTRQRMQPRLQEQRVQQREETKAGAGYRVTSAQAERVWVNLRREETQPGRRCFEGEACRLRGRKYTE